MMLLLFWICILAVLAGLVNALAPAEPFRSVALSVLVLALVLLVFGHFGIGPGLPLPALTR